jgi:hypothetical protein
LPRSTNDHHPLITDPDHSAQDRPLDDLNIIENETGDLRSIAAVLPRQIVKARQVMLINLQIERNLFEHSGLLFFWYKKRRATPFQRLYQPIEIWSSAPCALPPTPNDHWFRLGRFSLFYRRTHWMRSEILMFPL